MKRFLFGLCLVAMPVTMMAQQVRKMWVNMPTSIAGSLEKSTRQELLDLKEMKKKAVISGPLGEECSIDTLTADYLSVRLSDVSTLQMKMLPTSSGDSLLCLVQTYAGPLPESSISFYTSDWKALPMPSMHLDVDLQRPDTMTQDDFSKLQALFDPKLISFTLSPSNKDLVVALSPVIISEEEKAHVKALTLQRKLNWNGKTFN
ncbi:DUF3256 family protein [Hoylesella loescheii]|uniref:DUF3256 family protein n=1 Tax=Hoylesella loescheii TaxID=840 RepID=UPI00248DECE0|nr:DUF3256 family protein [Hoylesella loescheii]